MSSVTTLLENIVISGYLPCFESLGRFWYDTINLIDDNFPFVFFFLYLLMLSFSRSLKIIFLAHLSAWPFLAAFILWWHQYPRSSSIWGQRRAGALSVIIFRMLVRSHLGTVDGGKIICQTCCLLFCRKILIRPSITLLHLGLEKARKSRFFW